jgi:hypothetical protein
LLLTPKRIDAAVLADDDGAFALLLVSFERVTVIPQNQEGASAIRHGIPISTTRRRLGGGTDSGSFAPAISCC